MKNIFQKKNIQKWVALILFLALTWQVYVHLTYLFRGADWSAFNVLAYRNEKKDSIDVVFVGGSSVYRFWNPLQAYKEQGFTSYDYTSSSLPAAVAISAIDELRRTQDPKLVVLDIRTFHSRLWDTTHPGGAHLYLDSMEPSIRRLKAVSYYSKILDLPFSEAITYYLDLIYYHTNNALASELNWSLIDHEISEETMRAAGYVDHGFLPGSDHYFFDVPNSKSDTCATLRDNILQCYIDLLEYVSSQDVSILLVESPFVPLENDVEEMNTLIQLAEEYHVPVLNTNEYTEEMELDYHTDFYDTNHVNILGAEKYTRFLANYLTEHYDLPDHRNDDQYAEKWESAYRDYEIEAAKLKEQTWEVINGKVETIAKEKAIREEKDPLEWLSMTNDSNLVVLFCKREIDRIPSYASLAAVKHLGLSSEVLSSENDYIGVYSGSLQYTGGSDAEYSNMINMIWDTMDDVPYSIDSDCIRVGECEFKTGTNGITYVIIDKNTREIVDYSLIDVNASGELVLSHLPI